MRGSRLLMAIFYVAALMGAGAVAALLVAAVLLKSLGAEPTGNLVGVAIQVGAALCAIGLGLRLIVASWIWFSEKTGRLHG